VSLRLLAGSAAGICLLVGLSLLTANRYFESGCMATNAAGQRVVIGTELSERGKQYKSENPADDNNAILESLGGRSPELAWTRESIERCRSILSVSSALWGPCLALGGVFALVSLRAGRSPRPARRTQKHVFLSYDHSDTLDAERIRKLLEANGIRVLIDTADMAPGERIEDFIDRSIREADVVVSLVSRRSLFSAWVAVETMRTLQRSADPKRFIACYTDDSFFADDFRLDGTRRIDDRLRQIESLLPDYASQKLDSLDLNQEKTRLYDLRNNLGLILATLKGSLCLDVRDRAFDDSGNRLVAEIRHSPAE
jgi:hypothetical protein